jgi:hypothetical protein
LLKRRPAMESPDLSGNFQPFRLLPAPSSSNFICSSDSTRVFCFILVQSRMGTNFSMESSLWAWKEYSERLTENLTTGASSCINVSVFGQFWLHKSILLHSGSKVEWVHISRWNQVRRHGMSNLRDSQKI